MGEKRQLLKKGVIARLATSRGKGETAKVYWSTHARVSHGLAGRALMNAQGTFLAENSKL